MPQHIAEKTFFQLLERREGKAVVEDLFYNLVKSTKRTCYDSSTCRVTFMLPDKAAPAGWHSKVIGCLDAKPQLFCPAIIEREDLPSDPTADRPHSRGLLQYQLRVLANGVSAGTVQACLSSSVTCTVTSVTRGLPSATDAYDSNYFVVSFDTATCPDQLKPVTHVFPIVASFFIHHHREFQRVPCFTCYFSFHSSAKCASRLGARLLDHHREYTGYSHAFNLLPGFTSPTSMWRAV